MELNKHLLVYWTIVFLTSAVVYSIGHYITTTTKWQNIGSRFTGEDAIWLLENSNIEVKNNGIEGESTPFRDYIRKNK